MRALLLIAHGSRRQASNDEVRALVDKLRPRLVAKYDRLEAAFLELAEPSIEHGIDRAVAAGAREVILFPLFLNEGRHVAEDIPAIVREAQNRHPGVRLELRPYLGAVPEFERFVLEQLS